MRFFNRTVTRIMLPFLIAAFILPLAACTPNQQAEATDELVLYVSDLNSDIMGNALVEFKKLYPDINVVVENYAQEDYEEYSSTLQTELSAGTGPDLVLYSFGELSDLFKMGESGVFCNINDFIEADSDFDLSGYNETVMDAGVINGQRYYVPISYMVQHLITSEENLEYWDVNITNESSFESIAAELAVFCEENKNNSSVDWTKLLFFQMEQFFPWSGIELVDYETQTVTVDTDEFRQLMELYKSIYPMDWGRYSDKEANTVTGSNPIPEEIASNQYLIAEHNTMSPFLNFYSSLITKYNQTPVVFNFGMYETTTAQPDMYAVINNGAENKYNAYLFLKVLLGQECQSYEYLNIPVLKDAATSQITNLIEEQDEVISDEFRQKVLENATVNITINNGFSYQMKGFVWEAMEPYFKGETDYDSCLAELENKLQLYLNE